MPNPEEIKRFFFEAMLAGYASGVDPSSSADLPNGKIIRFEDGEWLLVDLWTESPNSYQTVGTTTIFFKQIPVWDMQYDGQYNPDAIETLKLALNEAHRNSLFVGGRGVMKFTHNGLTYTNSPGDNRFILFNGTEQIKSQNGDFLGGHRYSGGIRFPKELLGVT